MAHTRGMPGPAPEHAPESMYAARPDVRYGLGLRCAVYQPPVLDREGGGCPPGQERRARHRLGTYGPIHRGRRRNPDPRGLSDLGPIYCVGGRKVQIPLLSRCVVPTMRLEIMNIYPHSPTLLATIAQIRQTPRGPDLFRVERMERRNRPARGTNAALSHHSPPGLAAHRWAITPASGRGQESIRPPQGVWTQALW